jgi:hypothetical protein
MKWYVFDETDCFDSFETVGAAATCAEYLIMSDMEGVHIVYMSEAQSAAYCKGGKLAEAFKVK